MIQTLQNLVITFARLDNKSAFAHPFECTITLPADQYNKLQRELNHIAFGQKEPTIIVGVENPFLKQSLTLNYTFKRYSFGSATVNIEKGNVLSIFSIPTPTGLVAPICDIKGLHDNQPMKCPYPGTEPNGNHRD
jgi:hypothetical protein